MSRLGATKATLTCSEQKHDQERCSHGRHLNPFVNEQQARYQLCSGSQIRDKAGSKMIDSTDSGPGRRLSKVFLDSEGSVKTLDVGFSELNGFRTQMARTGVACMSALCRKTKSPNLSDKESQPGGLCCWHRRMQHAIACIFTLLSEYLIKVFVSEYGRHVKTIHHQWSK